MRTIVLSRDPETGNRLVVECPFDVPESLTPGDQAWVAWHLELTGVEPVHYGSTSVWHRAPGETEWRRVADAAVVRRVADATVRSG